MKNKLIPPSLLFAALLMVSPTAQAQRGYEIGALALATAYRNASVKSGPAIGAIGFQPGGSFGAFLGQNMSDHFGGELRYLYAQNDLKVTSGGSEAKFSGRSHAIGYDLLIFAAGRRSRIRPFAAGGGGLKYYQGTGAERSFQPLSNLAILTRTNDTLPAVDFGGGVKIQTSRHTMFRLEFRDYITKVPKVFAASPGASISGLMHQWVPAFGFSWTF